ncbi:hypothetical protein T01_16197 [Trichinella spiralis]|uniref:Uncharacterized protein n=1 Tax=Trichinella spiralis TaxID=6334 RepID=A0A0V1AN60_TRISP|nr:hypothetical protein T01_3403 [Trichinella spiralis]KRY26269.1 hypothetical protein T01_11288 [Trichinella spiralis]KRY26274.1 hypothetical protein T01_16197 [Trichinella spiralis]
MPVLGVYGLQEQKQFVKPKFVSNRFIVEPIMPTFQIVISSDIYITCIPKRHPVYVYPDNIQEMLGSVLPRDLVDFTCLKIKKRSHADGSAEAKDASSS